MIATTPCPLALCPIGPDQGQPLVTVGPAAAIFPSLG